MHRHSVRKQCGFISIEVVIVLIIIALGIGLAVSRGAGLFGASNISEEQSNLATLIANIRTLKSANGYGAKGANLTPTLIALKAVPANMSEVAGVLYNVYGGTVRLTSTGMGFSIASTNLPKDACIALATRVTRSQFEETRINNGNTSRGEVTTVTATTDCSSDANTITWTIRS